MSGSRSSVLSETSSADRAPAGPRVIGVRGSGIDVAFPNGELPAINEALEIDWDGPWRLTVEVQSHRDPLSVRAVALQSSTGLRRGTPVRRSGEPLRVPVGEAVLGRLLNALGDPVDREPPLARRRGALADPPADTDARPADWRARCSRPASR